MKKSKLLVLLASLLLVATVTQPVYAVEDIEKNVAVEDMERDVLEENYTMDNEYIFSDIPQETINEMKKSLEQNTLTFQQLQAPRSITGTSLMASAFNAAGFNHVAEALDYSMLSLRQEPKIYAPTSSLVNDMWLYSPDFSKAVTEFLFQARAAGSYEYFKSTTMNFTMPNASKASILANTQLKKQTDLFGTLHAVKINLGVVKNGVSWTVLVHINDTFDFKKENYNGLVNLVNNIANYEQELGKVKPYNIMIYGNRSNLVRLPFNVPSW